jgi:hypothetical protein
LRGRYGVGGTAGRSLRLGIQMTNAVFTLGTRARAEPPRTTQTPSAGAADALKMHSNEHRSPSQRHAQQQGKVNNVSRERFELTVDRDEGSRQENPETV